MTIFFKNKIIKYSKKEGQSIKEGGDEKVAFIFYFSLPLSSIYLQNMNLLFRSPFYEKFIQKKNVVNIRTGIQIHEN